MTLCPFLLSFSHRNRKSLRYGPCVLLYSLGTSVATRFKQVLYTSFILRVSYVTEPTSRTAFLLASEEDLSGSVQNLENLTDRNAQPTRTRGQSTVNAWELFVSNVRTFRLKALVGFFHRDAAPGDSLRDFTEANAKRNLCAATGTGCKLFRQSRHRASTSSFLYSAVSTSIWQPRGALLQRTFPKTSAMSC